MPGNTLEHPVLGKFRGNESDKFPVTQFLGIKYASIEQRFAQSKIYEGGTEDATKYGPNAPQVPNSLQIEQEFLIQKALPGENIQPLQQELECLNLNMTIPKDFKGRSKLPVLVWIHGGGFLFGANSWPHTDMASLVSLSQKEGKPFIGISLNYRTGVFGFLASSELKRLGCEGNYGLRDQINGFLWIKKFISGFGGDPENVTAIGESCGGVSATLLLFNREPLFRRVVSMGGHALLMPPFPMNVSDLFYQEIIAALSLANLTPEERLEKLRLIPHEKIIQKVPMTIPNRPVVDGDLFSNPISSVEFQDPSKINVIAGKRWCDEILIGDCQADGYIMSSGLQGRKEGIAEQFIDSLNRSLAGQPELVSTILADKGIKKDCSGDEAFHKIVAVLTDVGFYVPTLIALKGWPNTKGRYLYHFNAANSFPGPLQGQASHILDVAYLFQNYNHFLSEADVKVAQNFGRTIISFANDGVVGWKPWSEQEPENYEVFGQTSQGATFGVERAAKRRPFIPKILEKYPYDLVWGAVQAFLGGH